MKEESIQSYDQGSYGYDRAFLKKHENGLIELYDSSSNAGILISPKLQGRVMTSTASGPNGRSFGWINHDLFESGDKNEIFNPYGGEERFWFGPEGGPFSFYFDPGKEQNFENWRVPALIDRESFDIVKEEQAKVEFNKKGILVNASGSSFDLEIQRKISLLSRAETENFLGTSLAQDLKMVSYETENSVTNLGVKEWTKESGMPSIWMLCMFAPSPTTVFIPFKADGEGTIVNDEYFGKVPSDRLMVSDSTIYFKIDGKLRTKIGVPPGRAKDLLGSYDSENNVLTLLGCNLPTEEKSYVNSNWGDQDDPFEGDVINSYNDGPVDDGSILGPFYEIETSSPAAGLKPQEKITHIQQMVHLQGDKEKLNQITSALFGLELDEIASKFSF